MSYDDYSDQPDPPHPDDAKYRALGCAVATACAAFVLAGVLWVGVIRPLLAWWFD